MTSRHDPHPPAPAGKPASKAGHGYRNEVSWDGGRGRQPYENQPEGKDLPPASPVGPEYAKGDRGAHSGQNREQMEQVRKMP